MTREKVKSVLDARFKIHCLPISPHQPAEFDHHLRPSQEARKLPCPEWAGLGPRLLMGKYGKHTYIHTYIRTYVRTYIHTYRQTDIQTYRHTDIHTYSKGGFAINICLFAVDLAEIKPPSPPRKQISQVVIGLPTIKSRKVGDIYIYIFIYNMNTA